VTDRDRDVTLDEVEKLIRELGGENRKSGRKRSRNSSDLGIISDSLIRELEELEKMISGENSLTVKAVGEGRTKNKYVTVGIRYDTAILLQTIKLKLMKDYGYTYPFDQSKITNADIIHTALLLYYAYLNMLPERVKNFLTDFIKVVHHQVSSP